MEKSGYLQSSANQLYGTIHLPDSTPVGGVLVIPPFGEEKKCAARLLVRTARALAARGVAVLRFDLSGTGESTGQHGSATLDSWVADSAAALRCGRDEAGDCPWSVLGARLGGNIALRLAALESVRHVMLLEPIPAGDAFMRDLQRRKQIKEMMGGGKAKTSDDEIQEAWDRGEAVDFDGFEIGTELARGLTQLALAAELEAVPAETAVTLCRVAASDRVPPTWRPVFDLLEARANGSATTARDKPFWGQLEYYESDILINEATRSLV